MSFVPTLAIIPLIVVFIIAMAPLFVVLAVFAVLIYSSGVVGRAYVLLRRTYRSVRAEFLPSLSLDFKIRYYLLLMKLNDAAEFVRYLIRAYRYRDFLFGAHGHFQEIRTIVHQVDRGEWPAELGDPFDHIISEAKRGMLATGSLLYDPD